MGSRDIFGLAFTGKILICPWAHLRFCCDSDVIWVLGHHKLTTRQFVEQFIQAYNIDNQSSSSLLVLCEGNPPVTGGFPSQRASNMVNVSMSWRHYANAFFKAIPCLPWNDGSRCYTSWHVIRLGCNWFFPWEKSAKDCKQLSSASCWMNEGDLKCLEKEQLSFYRSIIDTYKMSQLYLQSWCGVA